LPVAKAGRDVTCNLNYAGSRKIHRAAQVEERCFSAAAAAQKCRDFTGPKLERNPTKGFNPTFVGLANILDVDGHGEFRRIFT